MQEGRTAERLLQVMDVLFERPILSIRQLETALEVPYRTAKRYVERLEEIGILREVTGRARRRIYQAAEVLAILEDPQDGFDDDEVIRNHTNRLRIILFCDISCLKGGNF